MAMLCSYLEVHCKFEIHRQYVSHESILHGPVALQDRVRSEPFVLHRVKKNQAHILICMAQICSPLHGYHDLIVARGPSGAVDEQASQP